MDARRGEWRVPGYTEIRDLGTGGSGRVAMARYDADGTLVAIKYLSDELCADPGFVVRFRHEARLLELLDGPHSARFYEYVESDGGAAIVMELVDGVSLRAMLRSEGPTGAEAALVLLKGSLLGLAAAHSSGIVHRDFKPENIIIEGDGASKLVDFGIAVRSGDGVSGAGTPPYMAPEQWAGAPAGPSTDVYAATIVFFECLTGTRPFQSQNIAALARQHQAMPPPVEQVPAPLRGLVERGMAKHPADRPGSADAFLVELEAVAAEAYGPGWEDRGRRRLASLAALLALLFPLADHAPEASTSLAETELGGDGIARRGLKKLSVKIAAGAVGLAVVAAVTAVLVGTMRDSELQAQSSVVTPTPTTSDLGLDLSSAEPAITEAPEEPEESPTEEPTTPAPTTSEAAPPDAAPTSTDGQSTPKASPSKKRVTPPSASATGSAKPSPSATEDDEGPRADPKVDDTLPSGRPRPTPTVRTPEPAPTPTPSPTRGQPSTPSGTAGTPTREPETGGETPTGRPETGGDTPTKEPGTGEESSTRQPETGGESPEPETSSKDGLGLLAAGLMTAGAVPATLALRKRMAGRHRRRR
ncbi:serine/threonine-protein kinase [Sphaerisporangium sp. TRM90804]|uniref:serine/threonine-protein kinase n=1 Tax=Sphaerisporangium sp. TRM90804 TaxID=3031113 RepID=UPI00244C8D6E|nr:serine/threonine-protein kinase [Sphaerisporangium sp. TRM90804]MDH2429060.1 protein kinase [Sphaerisporangium sp. TRM90804]